VGNGADNPITLNFAANITALDPQTVTILAVDDAVSEGLHTSTISHSASSADSSYNGGGVPFTPGANLSVNITDNDSPGFTVSPISGNTSETGGLASFTMRLNTQPSANVTVTLLSTDNTEGTASPTSVSFTNLTWNIPQIITATGVNDDVDDGDQTYIIQTDPAASSDIDYDNVNPADVTVVNIDDDSAGFTVSSISGNTSEDGITATFTIRLTSQPTSTVTIPVISSDTAEGTVAPASLDFIALNWNTPQTVTVTGVDDALTDGTVAYTIQTGPATSGDPGYNNLNPNDVSLLNLDNDGVILYLPVIVSGFTPAPDLVVDNLAASSNAVGVTIKNNGTAPVVDAFWVDVYLNPTTAPTGVNQRWQDRGSQGLTWGVQGAALPLDPGESLTLTIGDTYYFADLSNFSTPLPIGSTVYAQVDSVNFLTTYGNVQESHEISGGTYNNISSTTSISGAADAPTVTTGSKASADNGDLPRRD
jgi:hypothetical protein